MTDRLVVGTGAQCDVRIEDAEYMSTRHFMLTRDDQGVFRVEDLGSTNGTRVFRPGIGWQRVYLDPVPIGPGTKIAAGRVVFEIDEQGHTSVHRER